MAAQFDLLRDLLHQLRPLYVDGDYREFRINPPLAQQILNFARRAPSQFATLYVATIMRIHKETAIFKVAQDLEMMQDIYRGFDNSVGGVPVQWNDPTCESDGTFNPIEWRIQSPHPPPSRELILFMLALLGKFPFTIDMVQHELFHRRQFPLELRHRLGVVFATHPVFEDALFPGLEFMEVSAYRTSTMEPHEATPQQLLEHLTASQSLTGEQVYQGVEHDKVVAAIHLVDCLLAVGINTLELCSLAYAPGGWDERKKTYPKVLETLLTLLRQQRIPPNKLEELRAQYISSRVQDERRACAITWEEFGRVTG